VTSLGSRLWLLGAFGALACSAQVEEPTSATTQSNLYARFLISHSESAGATPVVQGDAVAGFARIPNDVDSVQALELLGLERSLPESGSCSSAVTTGGPTPAAALEPLQLLEAGDVKVQVGAEPASLAPRAFPTLLGGVGGVVYTSRERDAAELPFGVDYRVTTSGSDEVPAVNLAASAPVALLEVRVQGTPLAEVTQLNRSGPLDLSWALGTAAERTDSTDRVWIQLTSAKGSAALLCSFDDAAGVGTIPAGVVHFSGDATLTIHRSRTVREAVAGTASAVLYFDYSLSRPVSFVDSN
jgi:hypothetical protein